MALHMGEHDWPRIATRSSMQSHIHRGIARKWRLKNHPGALRGRIGCSISLLKTLPGGLPYRRTEHMCFVSGLKFPPRIQIFRACSGGEPFLPRTVLLSAIFPFSSSSILRGSGTECAPLVPNVSAGRQAPATHGAHAQYVNHGEHGGSTVHMYMLSTPQRMLPTDTHGNSSVLQSHTCALFVGGAFGGLCAHMHALCIAAEASVVSEIFPMGASEETERTSLHMSPCSGGALRGTGAPFANSTGMCQSMRVCKCVRGSCLHTCTCVKASIQKNFRNGTNTLHANLSSSVQG